MPINNGGIISGNSTTWWGPAGTSARMSHRLPVPEEEEARFQSWLRAFNKHAQHGVARGWLAALPTVTPPRGELVWDETEAEYQTRITTTMSPATVSFDSISYDPGWVDEERILRNQEARYRMIDYHSRVVE